MRWLRAIRCACLSDQGSHETPLQVYDAGSNGHGKKQKALVELGCHAQSAGFSVLDDLPTPENITYPHEQLKLVVLSSEPNNETVAARVIPRRKGQPLTGQLKREVVNHSLLRHAGIQRQLEVRALSSARRTRR